MLDRSGTGLSRLSTKKRCLAEVDDAGETVDVRITPKKTEVSVRYFISSWSASAQAFLKRIREHWQIENGLHWVLDIAFREDESRIRMDHAPQNMTALRHMALNLLKQDTSVKVGIAAKRKMAGWDNNYLLKVVCP